MKCRQSPLQEAEPMARRIGQTIHVETRRDGHPTSFRWRRVIYRVRVLSRWKRSTRWWMPADAVHRTYFRVATDDQQTFDIYRDAAQGGVWVLEIWQH